MNVKRKCFGCKTPLPGKKGHGFVIANGKSIVCASCAKV